MINSFQFNLILGFFSIITLFLSNVTLKIQLPTFIIVFLSLILLVGEAWAFIFKLKYVKIREIINNTKKIQSTPYDGRIKPGCMMIYAFLIRMIFRISIGMYSVLILGQGVTNEANTFQKIFIIIIVLAELFNFAYCLFETNLFIISGEEEDTEKEKAEYWEKEKKWRIKNIKIINQISTTKKEVIATIFLLIMAIVCTKLFWDSANNQFIEYIVRTKNDKDSYFVNSMLVLFSCLVLCFFFLMPIRLAFWVEEKMKADKKSDVFKYRLSLIFAGISVCSPSIIQLLKSYLLQH
ncbi:MAG: hypothetical protein HYU67_05790 [Flavobacteriia bacterium]|nr:hypothetical protein [Flavobacteriia bacterium]